MFRLKPIRVAFGITIIALLAGAYMAQGDTKGIRLSTKILGQNQWLAGSRASLRVITVNQMTAIPVAGASVDITMAKKDSKESTRLYTGRTNLRGTADVAFNVPPAADGAYTLKVVTQALGETDEVESAIKIKRENRILLTTDKPLYQPGQTIHIRALALSIPRLTPVAGRDCTLEVDDAKGNKVFKKTEKLSKFGVMGTDFQLANEINKGSYTIRALVDNDKVEKKVTVDRYVLPKFKVTLTTDRKYYLPGQKVKGTIHADYFFGKPVSGGKVVVKLSKFDVGFNDFAEVNGTTSDAGVFEFEQDLPTSFVGQPLEQGNAFFKAEVNVTDGADHTEKAVTQVPVAKDPLKILAVPESGKFVPEVENKVYVVVSYPDGAPAKANVAVFGPVSGKIDTNKLDMKSSRRIRTSALGIAEFAVTPPKEQAEIMVQASADGSVAAQVVPLTSMGQEEGLILRTDKAVAAVGDDLNLTVLSSKPSGYVYVDVVKDGQTMLTKSLQFKGGKGEAVVPLTSDLFGTINVHAYRISRTGNIIRDTRTVVVNPANDLRINVSADKKSYLPGQPAKIDFDVKDRQGHGLAAALGVSIVDESVFALQEMQPGLEKIYFMLEKELAEPKYEIHGITPNELIRPIDIKHPQPLDADKQEAAKVLFAAARKEQLEHEKPMFTLQADSYANKIDKIRDELAKQVREDYKTIAKAINEFYEKNPKANLDQLGGVHYLVEKGLLPYAILKDQWGQPYDFVSGGWGGGYRYGLAVVSSGPDRRKDTVDDIAVGGAPQYDSDGQIFIGRDFDDRSFGINGLRKGVAFGGMRERMLDLAVPRAAAAPEGMVLEERPVFKADAFASRDKDSGAAKPEVRIRQYFPETLYFNPAVITDDHGKGSISLNMADSITSWRLTAMGSSLAGLLGSTTQGIKVFQDFFIDIDLPVALTQNDEVTIPIAVYNYLPASQKVRLQMTTDKWFELDGAATKTLDIASGDVKAVNYRIKVKDIGWHKLTVHAYGSKMNDAISREIEVLPDGQEFDTSVNDRLEKTVSKKINIPADAIDGASNILVKVYPGYLSQVIEGMDKIFRMPFGCFEQTSSTTYPNILVLDYMRTTNQSTPELQMKAEQYINLGYQRLLSFEVAGGGFEWFGNAPANKVLTAYGLLEFNDMSHVFEVDPNVITRTQQWLVSKQNADGSWTPDKGGIAEGAINRQTDDFRTTAYVLWALAESNANGNAVNKAVEYVQKNAAQVKDPYALGLAANALTATASGKKTALDVMDRLTEMAQKTEDGDIYWKSEGDTPTFGSGKSADLETTGLITLALIKSGSHADTVNGALSYIIKSKDPNGTWYSTQATILCLKALIASISSRTQQINAKVNILINGKQAGSFQITPENSDVMRQVDGKEFVKEGENTVEIRFEGKGSSLYQISNKYYLPWDKLPKDARKLMQIDVKYDRTQLEKDDVVTANVKVAFNGRGKAKAANMVIVDLGIPPGFDLLSEDLEKLVNNKTIMKYSLTGRQAIIYLDKVEDGKPVSFSYRLRAKFPIKAKTPKSTVYQYYNPEARDVSPPVEMVVK